MATLTPPRYCGAKEGPYCLATVNHVQAEPTSIEGSWVFSPLQHTDDLGVFLESFKESVFSDVVGHSFDLKQMNISVSQKGTVRGIHFADVPPGQAKYVQCFTGSILDVVVDIRVGSATFGEWEAVELDSTTRKGLYVAEGLGHAFCALTESATVGYLCSEPYAPTREHGINPLDSELGISWPDLSYLVLSDKDAAAPSLADAMSAGLLPHYGECEAWIAKLKTR